MLMLLLITYEVEFWKKILLEGAHFRSIAQSEILHRDEESRFCSWLGNFVNIGRSSATRSKNSHEKWRLFY